MWHGSIHEIKFSLKTGWSVVVWNPDPETEAAALSIDSFYVNLTKIILNLGNHLLGSRICFFSLLLEVNSAYMKARMQSTSEKMQQDTSNMVKVTNMCFQSIPCRAMLCWTERHTAGQSSCVFCLTFQLIYEQDHRNSCAIASGCLHNKRSISD